jgi:hypothetical protein
VKAQVRDEMPRGYPITEAYRERVENAQDLVVIISDASNRRGTGKTVLSLKLAHMMDRTEQGLTKDKVAIDPSSIQDQYVEAPKGSALVLDEAEAGLSKYRAGSQINVMMRRLVSMGRVREKYLILNLPASSELDRDLKALCDVWLLVTSKGTAQGHFLNWEPYREKPLTPKTEQWRWSDIPESHSLRGVYDHLAEQKMKHLRGEAESGSEYISRSELDSALEKARKDTKRDVKHGLLRDVYRSTDLTQQDLADSVGISRSYLADIVSRTD